MKTSTSTVRAWSQQGQGSARTHGEMILRWVRLRRELARYGSFAANMSRPAKYYCFGLSVDNLVVLERIVGSLKSCNILRGQVAGLRMGLRGRIDFKTGRGGEKLPILGWRSVTHCRLAERFRASRSDSEGFLGLCITRSDNDQKTHFPLAVYSSYQFGKIGIYQYALAHNISSPHDDPWKRNVLGFMLDKAILDNLILFPLVALGSLYVLNRGSLWKRPEEFHPKLFERPQIGSLVAEKPTKSRDIQQAAEEIGARVVVLWGSQFGFAEALAHSLAQDIQQRFAVRPLLADLADYDAKSITRLPKSLPVIFIVSTYGEGDPPDNAQEFFSWSRTAEGPCLTGFSFAAFGCGNSNYQNYNKVVDDLQAFLESAGATAIVSTGKGDEATRITKEDFMDWKDVLAAALSHKFGFLEVEREYEPSLHVAESEPITGEDDSKIGAPFCQPTTREAKHQPQIIKVPILSRRLLAHYDEHNRSCVEVVADLSSYSNVKYKTGDHIAVWPENPANDVQMVLQLLGLYEKKDTIITISPRDGRTRPKLPTRTTIDALFRHYLDICGPVSRETVLALSRMASTSFLEEHLSAIATSKETFLEHLTTNHLSFGRILEQTIALDSSASWKLLSLSFVIDHVSPLVPRLYSISSSAMISPRQVSLTVANKPTVLVKNPSVTIPGLASSLLTGSNHSDTFEHNLSCAPTIYAQIRQTNFKLPVNPTTPIVLVAAGSGIAPFRAFIQERARHKSLGRDVGRMILFFGCQNQHDFLYQDELNTFTKGPLAGILRVTPAFSRSGPTKQYVQDLVDTCVTDVCDLLLEKDAAIYFCGSALMARQVNQTIRTQVMREKELDDNRYDGWRAHKKLTKRWFEDVWG